MTSCVCPGHQLTYECTIVGPAIQYTVWKGSALDCNTEVSLHHGQFIESGYASATCNGGEAFAHIVNITDSCYTSQLIVNTSLSLNSKSIECAFDNGAIEETIESMIIRITTGRIPVMLYLQIQNFLCIINAESSQSPNDVRLSYVQSGRITFNWTSVDALCDSISYNIISSNCGRCPSMTTNTTATCSDVMALGQVCTFAVRTVVCGNITGNMSHPVHVILRGRHALLQIRDYYVTANLVLIIYSSTSSRCPHCSNV